MSCFSCLDSRALDKEIIFHSTKTLLINNSTDRLFDITMELYDGSEACKLVVCYLLTQLNKELNQMTALGLYIDAGLAAANVE